MKVTCEGCQARYQIPDHRVAGRKLKIRCRRCSEVIVVRGDLLAAQEDEPETTVAAPPSEQQAEPSPLAQAPATPEGVIEWHVSLEGEQMGPCTIDQLTAELSSGALPWDAYVWRDGYEDWRLAREAEELIDAVMGVSAGPPAEADGEESDDSPTRMFDSGSYAATSSAPAPSTGLDDVPVVEPRVVASESMTGARHEDSVLFSQGNLEVQAPREPVAAAAIAAGYGSAGYASGEGSGLIDIRALAALSQTTSRPLPQTQPQASVPSTATMHPPATDEARRTAELMQVAHQTGAFGAIDSLAPVARKQAGGSSMLPWYIAGGSVLVSAAAVAAIILYRPAVPAQPVAAVVPVAAPAEEPAPQGESEQPAAVAEEPQEPAAEPATEAAEEAPAELADSRPVRRKVRVQRAPRPRQQAKKREKKADKSAVGAAKGASEPLALAKTVSGGAQPADEKPSIDDLLKDPPAPKAEPAKKSPEPTVAVEDDPLAGLEEKKKEPAKERSIDDLMSGAVAKGSKKKSSPPTGALPATPGRADVLKAMRSVDAAVRSCAGDEKGKASVAVKVASSGRVTGVQVTGLQGTAGSCIARAVRKAKFPEFSKPTFSFDFPYRFK